MSSSSGSILVYGATGAQGSAVVRAALASGLKVRVLLRESTRNPFGETVEVVRGDLADPASLRRATDGVDGVYFMMPVSVSRDDVVRFGRHAIDAAVAAGAGMLVFNTSGPGADGPTGVAAIDNKIELETYLQKSRLPSVILRATVYMDNMAAPWSAPAIVHHGVLAYVLPADQRVSWISWAEAASHAVAALRRPDLAAGKPILRTGGPQALSGTEVAEILGRAIGRTVTYAQIPLDRFEAGLAPVLGPQAAGDIARFYKWVMDPASGNPFDVDLQPLNAALPLAQQDLAQWATQIPWKVLAGVAA